MDEKQENVINIEEAIERLEMSRAEVYRKVKDGTLKAQKVDHVLHFSEEDIDKLKVSRSSEKEGFQEALEHWLGFYADRLIQKGEEELPNLEDKSDDDRVKELQRRIVLDGILTKTGDIYLDPLLSGERLLYRSEGILREMGILEGNLAKSLKGKLKTLIKVSEGSHIIEGIHNVKHGERAYQVRITAAPTLLGEHIHLHFYDTDEALDIQAMGYTDAQIAALHELLTGRSGIFLVVGAANPETDHHRLTIADQLTASGRLVVSLEHRIQYRSELLVQLELGQQTDEEFDASLRMALNMSPDVLMFDNVRNANEARALLEASSSGAVVVAQVRGAGGVEAILRLLDFEVSRDSLARALLGVVEHLAVRRLCPQCKAARVVTPEEAEALSASSSAQIWEARMCESCGDGFLGRRMLYGLWSVDEEFTRYIRNPELSTAELAEWRDRSPYSINVAAKEAVLNGEVSFDDVKLLLTQKL
jgi:type II secretory ATPase GspE/PulE/Tfp pilus assembly ATPase PilB-like protein